MKQKLTNLKKRHYRVRSKIVGTTERPRLCVYKSNKYIFTQIIDDEKGLTLVGFNSKYAADKKLTKMESSVEAGKRIAELAKKHGVTKVVFDRGGYKYHGRVKSFADAAREGGLEF